MEYGQQIQIPQDENSMRYVGWQQSNNCIKSYYSPLTVKIISRKVTELLQGVDSKNRKIIVPKETIAHVMSSVQNNYIPQVGDIFTRYHITSLGKPVNMVQQMIDRVIEIIVQDVKTFEGMKQHNETLTKWTTVLGDFNNHGLRSHDVIKIQNKHPKHMMFFENY